MKNLLNNSDTLACVRYILGMMQVIVVLKLLGNFWLRVMNLFPKMQGEKMWSILNIKIKFG